MRTGSSLPLRVGGFATSAALIAPLLLGLGPAAAEPGPVFTGMRGHAPVVLTGAQLPQWSRAAAVGVAKPQGVGPLEDARSAHNGTVTVPPDARTGTPVDEIAAYRWSDTGWTEVPVQVDERFPHFLVNSHSEFHVYSGTDQELTYSWAPTAHTTGEEAWKKIFGDCYARYADPRTLDADIAAASRVHPDGEHPAYSPADGEQPIDYTRAKTDPAAGLDDDDEIALQASDAGVVAPTGRAQPYGTTAGSGQTVAIGDPTTGTTGYVYLFRKPGGSSFTAADGYVQMTRDANADEWIARESFIASDPEILGSSNTGYGANLPGTICTAVGSSTPTFVKDRFPRDGMTVTTDRYRLRASGRWMIRGHQVRRADGSLGPDLIDRWKGRAFQQSPDSSVSVVGFEDEQVNWEANASLLGWRQGPVRAIREIWGADSGTNVTKTETYYRSADVYRYRVRVHPIPADGLYTSWDYNQDAAGTYFNTLKPQGVPIDGINDDAGQIDELPQSGQPAFVDVPDPTFDLVSAVNRPEQVAGKGANGSLVYVFEFKGPTSAANADAVPYYRDDACLDDGTGDNPVPRPWPGEASTDSRVKAAYVNYWKARGAPASLTWEQLKAWCAEYKRDPSLPEWQKTPFQGAFGAHGIHFFITQDSDNGFTGVPLNEIDGQQWRYPVQTSNENENVIDQDGDNWALNVLVPLAPVVVPYRTSTVEASPAPTRSATPTTSASTSPSASTTASPTPSASTSASASAGATASASATPTGTASASPTPTSASAAVAGGFHALTPARVLDTRRQGGVVRAGSDRLIDVRGQGGVPSRGVRAVVLNSTVTTVERGMNLQLYPVGARPAVRTSNLNAVRGQTVANVVTAPVGADGRIGLSVSHGSSHVVLDVLGWYGDGTEERLGDGYMPVTPSRRFDSRAGAPVAAGADRTVPVIDPAAGAGSVVVTVTALGAPADADVQVYPAGSRPARRTSTLNLRRGQTVANLAVVPVDEQGRIVLSVSQRYAHVVVDLLGYYVPDSPQLYRAVAPNRTYDTRRTSDPVRAGADRAVRVLGTGGVPSTGVSAVLLNVTSTRSTKVADLQVFPTGERPARRTSNLNVGAGQDAGTLVLAKVGRDGSITLSTSQGAMDVVLDVMGWVSSG